MLDGGFSFSYNEIINNKGMIKMKKTKKLFIVFLCFVFLIGAYALSVNFYIIGSAQKRIYETEEIKNEKDIDYVLVLGCGVKPDGTPSHMLYERVKKGAEVFLLSKADKLLLTGDRSGESYDEPGVMKKLALEMGVKENQIQIDDIGYSTFESIWNAKYIYNAEKIVIITQPYHLPRALYIAKSLGLDAIGAEAYLPFYIKQVMWSLREVAARNKDFIVCNLEEHGLYYSPRR